MKKFQINNDLKNPRLNAANAFHFLASLALSWWLGFGWAWLIGILWEIGDGFKPWYWEAPIDVREASLKQALRERDFFIFLNWCRREFFFSDKFSLQDVFIWDFLGCLVGVIWG